jgi:CII-binding regulator of phage lambda lysogenization HflD
LTNAKSNHRICFLLSSMLALDSVLDRKETMITALQDKLVLFSESLEKEQELSKQVGAMKQY